MRHFFAHVAGESYRNDDGSDRQLVIFSCRVGEALTLQAQPDNPEDENAVCVLREDGGQIGYLERGMAARLVDDLSDFSAFVAGVGQGGGPYHGVALLIVVNDGQDAPAVEAYARRVLKGEGRLDDFPSKRARATASCEGQGASDALLGWARIFVVIILGVLAIWWWL